MHRAPTFQMRQHRAHKRHGLVARHSRAFRQARCAVFNHGVHYCFIGIFALLIAPFAIMRVDRAMGISAVFFGRKHHSAAFAVMLRPIKEMRNGLVQHIRDKLQHINAGRYFAPLPPRHRLTRHVQFRRKLLLSEPIAFAQINKLFSEFHSRPPKKYRSKCRPSTFPTETLSCAKRHSKQHLVAQNTRQLGQHCFDESRKDF